MEQMLELIKKNKVILLLFVTVLLVLQPAASFAEDAPWYSPAAEWAVQQGIISDSNIEAGKLVTVNEWNGYLKKIEPNAVISNAEGNITRADAVNTLYETAGKPGNCGVDPFTDVSESDSCYNAVLWAYTKGITKGTGDNKFSPDDYVPEEQAIAMLYRYSLNGKSDYGENEGIDYLVLVNKLNQLPEDWEEKLETIHITNSLGDNVEVETKAYEAYLQLKDSLAKDGIYVDLDSARRSIAEQQDIVDRFTVEYGADYVKKYVAVPGYSEHHTGLALDLYLNINGVDVYLNEDMVQYPQIWDKIHERLADYGFILRYLEGKEHITGYNYEPWHIRYVETGPAKEIMDKGITLETYLGKANDTDPTLDYGKSEIYSREQIDEIFSQIKCSFAAWEGCELHSIHYAGDECCSEENLKWMNSLNEGQDYKAVLECLTDFHSPKEGGGAWEPDEEYKDWQWWYAQNKDGDWEFVTGGY